MSRSAERRARIKQLADAVMVSGNPATALELLHETREALDAKGEEIEALGQMSDKELEANGQSRATVKAMAHDHKASVAALDNLETGTMSAQLGLDTVVPGQVYAGEPAAIARVLDSYRDRPGYRIEREGTGYHVVGRDGTAFHILERAPTSEGNVSQTPVAKTEPTSTAKVGTGAGGTTTGPPAQPEVGRDPAEQPMRTPYGDVWPGEVPEHVPPAQREVFVAAKKIYDGLRRDPYQGASIARIRWGHYLVEHGIPAEGGAGAVAHHPVYETSPPARVPAPSDVALPREPSMGARSANTKHVTQGQSLAALDELMSRGSVLKGAHRDGDTVRVPRTDGTTWTIRIGEPRPTSPDEMAALVHGEHGDTVWVSDTLTNDQVGRALGAIIGESLSASGAHGGDGARFGELDAMFARRDTVASSPIPEVAKNARPADIKSHALAASRAESAARIDAEIDLALHRIGVDEPGPRRDAQLAAMPPELAAKVRARIAQHGVIGFSPDAVRGETAVARVGTAPDRPLGVSEVLPDPPAQVHPYTEADRTRVLELRVELETIREIDARVANRDRPGTNGGTDIAKGETQRRAEHVARARALMGGASAWWRHGVRPRTPQRARRGVSRRRA